MTERETEFAKQMIGASILALKGVKFEKFVTTASDDEGNDRLPVKFGEKVVNEMWHNMLDQAAKALSISVPDLAD